MQHSRSCCPVNSVVDERFLHRNCIPYDVLSQMVISALPVLPAAVARRLEVADGDRHAVGGVVGLWRLREPKKLAHHLLHLFLVRIAIPTDRLLYLGRRIFDHVEPC